ncbi:hypothetical protein KIN20_035899 [Parelaphostrongylus tenuis]|uniref:Uncharacterized protein n=1 Tax=Parelaphostrongylus tenuis TaxID=148309 RepID=A0AAD5WK23_PARTN|nr:hypothetical protein KIN20_035899 [Parelaphostrongylus tenuis]
MRPEYSLLRNTLKVSLQFLSGGFRTTADAKHRRSTGRPVRSLSGELIQQEKGIPIQLSTGVPFQPEKGTPIQLSTGDRFQVMAGAPIQSGTAGFTDFHCCIEYA